MKKIYPLLLFCFILSKASFSQISFTPDQSFGCSPITINFTNNSVVGDNYQWYFGDGYSDMSFGIGAGISHTYNFGGNFTVYMTAFNGATYLGDYFVNITIEGMPSTLYISDTTVCPGDEISVDIGNAYSNDITWDFGDGTVLSNVDYQGVRHIYNSLGSYTITCTAVFPTCGSMVGTRTLDVGSSYPLATNYPLSFSSYEDTVCPGDRVEFDIPYQFPNYYISYGDGVNESGTREHIYLGPGDFPAYVTLVNGCNNTLTLYDTVAVRNGLPVNLNSGSQIYYDTVCINTNLELYAPSNAYTEYFWNFGNGQTSTSENATVSFPTAGEHIFTLTVSNGCGNSATISDTIVISNNLPVSNVAIDGLFSTSLCPGDGFFMSAEASGSNDSFTYHWDFGDGNTADVMNISHVYDSPGTYIVTLTATNFCGNSASFNQIMNVGTNVIPDPQNYQMGVPDNNFFCPGDSVILIFGPSTPGASIYWDFDDGNNGYAVNTLVVMGVTYNYIKHAYSSTGIYNPSVTFTNSCGNSFTDNSTVVIGNGVQPEAFFFEDFLQYNCQNQPLEFFGLGGSTFIWNFGDGSGFLVTNSPLDPVEHVYEHAGNYNVTLEVFNGCGLSDQVTEIIEIPESEINITTNSIASSCGNADGKAVAVVSGGTGPYNYLWSNGDMTFIADTIPAGIYQVNVEDKNGCKNFAIATVSDAEAPTILTSAVVDVACHGNSTGAIDISVIGSSAPYTFIWSNGSVNEDVNLLEAGPHEVIVTDANGCISTKSIYVNEPGEVVLTTLSNNSDCGFSNGQAAIAVSGNTGPYSYLWSNGANGILATGLSAGIYDIIVVDANGCIFEESVTVSEGNMNIILDSITGTGCTGDLASIYIKVLPNGNYSYDWNTGQTTEDISSLSTGLYNVEITDINNGCVGYAQYLIDDIPTNPNDICLVSVDSISNTNKVIWEKDLNATNISHYAIYKESSQAGIYYLVDEVPYDSMSVWVDPVSNPQVRSWRYKIAVVDDCGNESVVSDEHKTIHLTVNEGINNTYNLIWDHYDGLTYSTYDIYRKTNASGWVLIASIPSNLNSYTDATPPAGTEYYRVEALTAANCDPTRAGVNTSRSNVRNTPAAPPFGTTVEENVFENLIVYPNPSTGIFKIDNPDGVKSTISVYNLVGEKIISKNISGSYDMDLTGFATGMYILQIENNSNKKSIKLIKE